MNIVPYFPFFLISSFIFYIFLLISTKSAQKCSVSRSHHHFQRFFQNSPQAGKKLYCVFLFCLSFLFGKLFLTFVRWFKRFPAKIDKRRIQQNLLFITVFYAFNNFVCTWIIKCFHFFVFTQIALSFLALSYLIMHLIINIFLHAQLNIIFKAILAVFCCCLNEYTL